MGRSLRGAARVFILLTLAAVVAVAAVYVTHPRNDEGYLAYVDRYGNYDGRSLQHPPPATVLLAAGDRACDWLGRQPPALWRDDRRRTVGSLLARYDSEMPRADRALPETVPAGAWAHLCPATREFVEPHRPFGTASD